MRLKGSVRQINNLLSLFFLRNLNFVISTRIAKLAPVLTRQNSIRVQGIFFGVYFQRIIAEMFYIKKEGKNSINVMSDLKDYNTSYDIILDQLT